jgi:hypothetical protein
MSGTPPEPVRRELRTPHQSGADPFQGRGRVLFEQVGVGSDKIGRQMGCHYPSCVLFEVWMSLNPIIARRERSREYGHNIGETAGLDALALCICKW